MDACFCIILLLNSPVRVVRKYLLQWVIYILTVSDVGSIVACKRVIFTGNVSSHRCYHLIKSTCSFMQEFLYPQNLVTKQCQNTWNITRRKHLLCLQVYGLMNVFVPHASFVRCAQDNYCQLLDCCKGTDTGWWKNKGWCYTCSYP